MINPDEPKTGCRLGDFVFRLRRKVVAGSPPALVTVDMTKEVKAPTTARGRAWRWRRRGEKVWIEGGKIEHGLGTRNLEMWKNFLSIFFLKELETLRNPNLG